MKKKIEEKIESREEGEVKDEDFSGENSHSWCCVILEKLGIMCCSEIKTSKQICFRS